MALVVDAVPAAVAPAPAHEDEKKDAAVDGGALQSTLQDTED